MSTAEDPEVILPPAHGGIKPPGTNDNERNATARIIAQWLDNLIPIPGTSAKIGLDPIIAFIPGAGDFLSSSVSAVVIIESIRRGVPLSVIARMVLNMVINGLINLIPGLGPVVSAFFKSNSRNLGLLQRCQEGEMAQVQKGSRIVLMIVFGIFFLAFASFVVMMALYLFSIVWSFTQLYFNLTSHL